MSFITVNTSTFKEKNQVIRAKEHHLNNVIICKRYSTLDFVGKITKTSVTSNKHQELHSYYISYTSIYSDTHEWWHFELPTTLTTCSCEKTVPDMHQNFSSSSVLRILYKLQHFHRLRGNCLTPTARLTTADTHLFIRLPHQPRGTIHTAVHTWFDAIGDALTPQIHTHTNTQTGFCLFSSPH